MLFWHRFGVELLVHYISAGKFLIFIMSSGIVLEILLCGIKDWFPLTFSHS
jgi:hypothetical protein